MKCFILLTAILVITSCNPAKKVAKYNEDVKREIASYVENNPCINDTITQTKSDTIIHEKLDTVTNYETINDTVIKNVTTIRTVTNTIIDTVTNTITDNRLVNFWKDSANAANRSREALQSTLANKTIESTDWKHSARNRLYLLIGVCVAFGIWTFRKPLMALIA